MKRRKVRKQLEFRNRRLIKLSEVKWGWTRNDAKELLKAGRITPRVYQLVEEMLKMLDSRLQFIREREEEEEDKAIELQNKAELDASNGESSESPERVPYSKYLPKVIDTDLSPGKGFAGTSLKLFPNVRDTKVEVGEESSWFKLFGINRRMGTLITMYLGPNRRVNRYLSYQYKRLINSIGGEIKTQNAFNDAMTSMVKVKYVKWNERLRDINDSAGINHPTKKKWRKKVSKFWNIAMNLVINSSAFRVVMITSVLGKAGRWYHRDITIAKILLYNSSYLKIAKNFKSNMPFRRKWIPSGDKWRPLSIAPIAWRIYSKGICTFLSVFLANSWAENQHGYTKGRGVQTAWNQILTNVIKSPNIFEFDLVGYFNNITHRCVVRQLGRFQTPKHIIMLLVELHCGSVTAGSISDLLKEMGVASEAALQSSPDYNSYRRDWNKHEFLHKYRDGWRNRGFPQGGSLSPLLSILPLILIEENKSSVKSISYCDDGILYGDESKDLLALLQELFDSNEVGVKVHPEKSGWIRKDGTWLNKLKFVGLLYDPFKDQLAACTRKGSVLPMQLDLVGLLSKEAKTVKHVVADSLPSDVSPWILNKPDFSDCPWDPALKPSWIRSNPWLCRRYGIATPEEENLGWNIWHFWKIIEWVRSDPDITIRIAQNDSGLWQFFRNIEKSNPDYAIELLDNMDKYLPLDIRWSEMWAIKKMGLEAVNLSPHMILGKGQDLADLVGSNKQQVALDVDLLVWHKNMIRNNIKTLLDNEVDLGISNVTPGDIRLFKMEPLSALAKALPDSILHEAVKHNWNVTLFLSKICWRNMVVSEYFGTLVSRLFIGSFGSEKIVQNFELTYEAGSLVDLGYRILDKREWARILHSRDSKLNVFNSTTIYSFVLAKLIDIWDRSAAKKLRKQAPVERAWWHFYSQFINRLYSRRVGKFPLGSGDFGTIVPKSVPGLQFVNPGVSAVGLPPSAKHLTAVKRKALRAFRDGIPIEAIAHSSCSEDMYRDIQFSNIGYEDRFKYDFNLLMLYRDNCTKKPKRSDWLTWAPYYKGPRGKVERPLPKPKSNFKIQRYFMDKKIQ